MAFRFGGKIPKTSPIRKLFGHVWLQSVHFFVHLVYTFNGLFFSTGRIWRFVAYKLSMLTDVRTYGGLNGDI